MHASQGGTENTFFFTVRSALGIAIHRVLISGVYGTASSGLLLLMRFKQGGHLAGAPSGFLGTPDFHKGHTDLCFLLQKKSN